MHWSLSEFLNLIEFRGQNWCFVDMAARSGISVGHSDTMLLHAVLNGTVRITRGTGETAEFKAGEIALILSGDAHTIRNNQCRTTEAIDLLNQDGYVDEPPTIAIGEGLPESRLLSGRLKVRWPGGSPPRRLPPMLPLRAADLGIELRKFAEAGTGAGAAAFLTRMAAMLFVSAFRDEPRCRALFRWDMGNPIARAQLLLEKHPFQPWTVEALAQKVGMGRSNFAARFTAEVGATPIDALTQVRMKFAEGFLRNTELKVIEISDRIGYRSEAAFIRRFTDHFGMTPGKFRRHARQGLQAAE
ncbi:MAG: helix-turn-helix transcriptional regulator [Novosphingobium sp.]|nr:helix-turn-helix transcriptional regulator [Novosphingobium sp.]